MNIFFLSIDPVKCAEQYYDTHVRKILLETAQMLSTAHRIYLHDYDPALPYYMPTHVSHPMCVWVRENSANYNWTFRLYKALCDEFEYRFGKPHKSRDLLSHLQYAPLDMPSAKFPSKMPILIGKGNKPETASQDFWLNAIFNYKEYYKTGKGRLKKYTKRPIPDWLADEECEN